ETILQSLCNLLQRQRSCPPRRQLQCQRNPIQLLTDASGRSESDGSEAKLRMGLAHALHKQLHRRILQQLRSVLLGTFIFNCFSDFGRKRERGNAPEYLSRQSQQLTTGRQHPQIGTCLQQKMDQFSDRIQQVLAVVHHQKQASALQKGGQGGFERNAYLF